MADFWLFMSLGLFGSAGPAHIGFRILAYRQHLDRDYPFAPGTESGQWSYGYWLMRFAHKPFKDPALNSFGNIAGVAGWLACIGIAGSSILILFKL